MSTPDFEAIKAILDGAAYRPDASPDEYLTLLERLQSEIGERARAARLAKFGSQFVPAGEPVEESTAQRQFQPRQQVFTAEGYLGYVVGHDAHGKAIVNVVWEAAEYPESKLTAIPGPEVLDTMRT